MTWQEFTALLVLATAMSFSPGPNTTLSTALAANAAIYKCYVVYQHLYFAAFLAVLFP